jgi:hypothetical protein
VRAVLRNPYLLLWVLFLIAFPFYVMPSGMPQPSSAFMVALLVFMIASLPLQLPRSSVSTAQALLLFLAYVVVVNLMWTIALSRFTLSGRYGFLIQPTYYIYNVALFLAGVVLYTRFSRPFLFATTYGAMASLALQTLVSLAHLTSSGNHLWFNNSNQLGYYAVLSASIVTFGAKRVRVPGWLQVAAICASGYLAVFSASRAALISVGAMALFSFFSRPRTLVVSLLLLTAAFAVFDPAADRLEHSARRFTWMKEDTGRGYDRIIQNPEHWLVGAGEGGYDRFADSSIGQHELHSSLGTVFFSYGVVGTLLFALFLLELLRRSGVVAVLQLLPAGVYGLAHQGLRFSLLWVLLVLLLGVGNDERTARRAASRALAP